MAEAPEQENAPMESQQDSLFLEVMSEVSEEELMNINGNYAADPITGKKIVIKSVSLIDNPDGTTNITITTITAGPNGTWITYIFSMSSDNLDELLVALQNGFIDLKTYNQLKKGENYWK
ncbi:MAG: hypothetical protein ACK4YF_07675 [Exilispira sp.]